LLVMLSHPILLALCGQELFWPHTKIANIERREYPSQDESRLTDSDKLIGRCDRET